MCPLPVQVFLQRAAGVHSAHGENPWEYTGRNAVLVGAALDGQPEFFGSMILKALDVTSFYIASTFLPLKMLYFFEH